MPQHFLVNPAQGGLDLTTAATNLGITKPDALVLAENVEYDNSGSRRKRRGTTRYNSSAVTEAGSAITFTALSDFWRYGTSRTPTQKFVAIGGTGIWKDDGDGIWDSGVTGWGANSAVGCITIAQGRAVFSTSNGTDTPRVWDQTTFATLASLGDTPPLFSISAFHLRRLFVAGYASNPSQITLSAAGAIQTWTGGDITTLTIDDDDGDALIGMSKSFHGRIYFFKGPNYGSVHELSNNTFSTMSRNKIIVGAPCVGHNSIITTVNDIFWCSMYGFHALGATQKYGDTEERFLSKPVQDAFNNLNFSRMDQVQGFWHPTRNIIGWACPESGQTENNVLFIYNYATDRWAIWYLGGFNAASVMVARDPTLTSRRPRLYLGDYAGFVHAGDQTTLSDNDGTIAYTARIRTPIFSRMQETDELTEKVYHSITTFFRPKGNYNATLDVVTDDRTQSSLSVSMKGIGAVLGEFILGTDKLGSNDLTYFETPFEEKARSIQLTYSLGGTNRDMEIYGYGIRYEPAEPNARERS